MWCEDVNWWKFLQRKTSPEFCCDYFFQKLCFWQQLKVLSWFYLYTLLDTPVQWHRQWGFYLYNTFISLYVNSIAQKIKIQKPVWVYSASRQWKQQNKILKNTAIECRPVWTKGSWVCFLNVGTDVADLRSAESLEQDYSNRKHSQLKKQNREVECGEELCEHVRLPSKITPKLPDFLTIKVMININRLSVSDFLNQQQYFCLASVQF